MKRNTYYQLQGGKLLNTKEYLAVFQNKEMKLPVIVAKFIIKLKKATA